MNVIIKKLKEIFSFTPAKEFIFTCECGEEFDGATVEIAIMVLGEQVPACRIEVEVPGRLALRRDLLDRCEFPRCLIDREDGDAVVPAVGPVEELA